MPDEIHFQWQNEFLLRTIYPMRSTKLRDFLVYFYEVDLWAEYKDKSVQEIEAEAFYSFGSPESVAARRLTRRRGGGDERSREALAGWSDAERRPLPYAEDGRS